MPKRGGARPGAGRKKITPELPEANKRIATEVLALKDFPKGHEKDCRCEQCRWVTLLNAPDLRIRFDTLKYLTDKRDGKAVQNVNHLHDKPIEHVVTHKLSEELQKARKRAGIS
jgi:hypothetical protein